MLDRIHRSQKQVAPNMLTTKVWTAKLFKTTKGLKIKLRVCKSLSLSVFNISSYMKGVQLCFPTKQFPTNFEIFQKPYIGPKLTPAKCKFCQITIYQIQLSLQEQLTLNRFIHLPFQCLNFANFLTYIDFFYL